MNAFSILGLLALVSSLALADTGANSCLVGQECQDSDETSLVQVKQVVNFGRQHSQEEPTAQKEQEDKQTTNREDEEGKKEKTLHSKLLELSPEKSESELIHAKDANGAPWWTELVKGAVGGDAPLRDSVHQAVRAETQSLSNPWQNAVLQAVLNGRQWRDVVDELPMEWQGRRRYAEIRGPPRSQFENGDQVELEGAETNKFLPGLGFPTDILDSTNQHSDGRRRRHKHGPGILKMCTGSFWESAKDAGNKNHRDRPPVNTPCVEPCVQSAGRWGSSYCFTERGHGSSMDDHDRNWGAECTTCLTADGYHTWNPLRPIVPLDEAMEATTKASDHRAIKTEKEIVTSQAMLHENKMAVRKLADKYKRDHALQNKYFQQKVAEDRAAVGSSALEAKVGSNVAAAWDIDSGRMMAQSQWAADRQAAEQAYYRAKEAADVAAYKEWHANDAAHLIR